MVMKAIFQRRVVELNISLKESVGDRRAGVAIETVQSVRLRELASKMNVSVK